MHEIIAGVLFCGLLSFLFCGTTFCDLEVWLVTLIEHPTGVRKVMGSISARPQMFSLFVLRSGLAEHHSSSYLVTKLKIDYLSSLSAQLK